MSAPEVWTDDPAPGGFVCGVEQHPVEVLSGRVHEGRWICGMPVEDEPCPEHSKEAGR